VAEPRSTAQLRWWGAGYLLLSSVAYTAANIYLRKVALECDPVWVSCIKAVPAAIVGLALVLVTHRRGTVRYVPRRLIGWLIFNALFVQCAGNVAFQESLGLIGLAVSVPLSFGTLIASSALLGRLWLGEPITPAVAVGLLVLVGAIVSLSLGAQEAGEAMATSAGLATTVWGVWLGLGLAGASGVAYAVNSAVIRWMVTGVATVAATLLVISWTGVVVLGGYSLVFLGPAELARTTPAQLADMLMAGTCNAVAFFALAKGLRHVTVIYANAVSASQSAMAALAGVALFGEILTIPLVVGTILTIGGLVLVDSGHRSR
jgi:drug/metabolite transporter (DMT)-like permease